MLFTRENDYTVRILRALANGEIANVQSIAEKEELTISITYKLARKLEKSGLLKSYRGVNGGYALAKPPEELSLYEVFEKVDANLLITECLEHGYNCPLNTDTKPCGVHQEFCRIQQIVNKELKAKKLTDLI